MIDEGIIIWFPGPQSYTGEDMAEFHVHGSRSVIEAIHDSISKIDRERLFSGTALEWLGLDESEFTGN